MLHFFGKRLNELHKDDRKGQKGFTLIELLVVVIIIGILAAIAIPAFLAQRDQARAASVQSDLRNAAAAAQTCAAGQNDDFTDFDGAGPAVDCSSLAGLQANGYNQSPGVVLAFPAGNTATLYQVNGTHANVAGADDEFNYDSNRGTVAAGQL